jgi:hypothetical protein
MPESFKKFSTAILETHCLDLGRGVATPANLPVHRSRGREVVGKERADACANVAEDCMRRLLAGHAEINGDGLHPRSVTSTRRDPISICCNGKPTAGTTCQTVLAFWQDRSLSTDSLKADSAAIGVLYSPLSQRFFLSSRIRLITRRHEGDCRFSADEPIE